MRTATRRVRVKTFSEVIYCGKTIRLRHFSQRPKGQTMNEVLTTRLYLLQNTREKSHSNLSYYELSQAFMKTYYIITCRAQSR